MGRPGTGVLFQLFLNKPIKTVADLKGMKIRVSPTNVPFMKAVGANPVQMPPSDVYTAMERGVVDGYILPAHTIRDFGLGLPRNVDPAFGMHTMRDRARLLDAGLEIESSPGNGTTIQAQIPFRNDAEEHNHQ